MFISSLCDYSDVYLLVRGAITLPDMSSGDGDANNVHKR